MFTAAIGLVSLACKVAAAKAAAPKQYAESPALIALIALFFFINVVSRMKSFVSVWS